MRAAFAIASGLMFIAGCAPGEPAADPTSGASQALVPVKSGAAFLTPETRALQDDDFANPGFLWVDNGQALFEQIQDRVPSCASCHNGGDAVIGASARYPAVDETTGDLLNIEGRINACRTRHQNQPALDYENEDLLALTVYVASLSRGTPIAVETGGNASRAYESGREYFFTRRGQFNLSCSNCHDANWGRKVRGDTISQGHGNGFPAYRLEWQSVGSLHRRFHDCDTGVRAEPLELGSDQYVALELYLAQRSTGLTVETPGVRR